MPAIEENFSKIVRSLLLDVDIHLDQLEQIGYLSREQRAFLDKFLYKSEDALRVAKLTRGSHGSDLLLTKLPSNEGNSPSCLTPSPSKSESGVGSVTSRVLPRLRSVTEQLKPEDNGLTTFLKRCNERNFSVQVRGTDIERQSTNKVKGSEYVLTLEPIAEGTVRAGGSNINIKVDNDKVLEHVNHDTNMMLHGAETLTCDMNVESVDYETTVHADVVANLSPDEPASNETLYPKAVDIRTANTEPTNIQPAVEPIKVEHNTVEPTNLKHTESQQSPEGITKFKLADAEVTIYQEQSQNTDHWDEATALQDPAVKTGEEVETNAWGKPMKPDPTRNKEGAIVGGQAKPLGAENKGRAMMEKMGWSSGTGLGKQMGGILEPITHVVKNTKTGLRTSDEKSRKSGLSLSFAENTPNSTSDFNSVEKPTNLDSLSESSAVDNSDWGQRVDNPNWDKPAKLTIEKIDAGADWAAAEKHAAELSKAEAESVTAKPQFIGIKAFYLREGDNPGPEKTIKFKTRIQSTNEYKTTMHWPGVIVRAMSPQGSQYSKRKDDSSFKVSTGNVLEILRVHQGDEYHVFSFAQRKRGIVKISLVEMMEEPQAVLADGMPRPSNPAAATV